MECTRLKKDVFISYSSKDQAWADSIYNILENNNLNCWIAHRDICPGEEWAEAINNAIKNSSIFLLVFSENSNNSPQVAKEISLAVNNRSVILPFKIDSCTPKASIEYYLSDTHWMVASGEREASLIDLKNIILSVLNRHANKNQHENNTSIEPSNVRMDCKSDPENTKQKKILDIVFIILAFVQILFGIAYNLNILPSVNTVGNPIFTYFGFVASIPVAIILVYTCSEKKTQPMLRLFQILAVLVPFFLITFILFKKAQYIIVVSFIKNLIFIALLVPIYIEILIKCSKAKFLPLWSFLLIVMYIVVANLIGGINLAFITMIALSTIPIFCRLKKVFSCNTMSARSICNSFVFSFCFFLLASPFFSSAVSKKLNEWINAGMYEKTLPIFDILQNFEFVDYNINPTVLSNMNSIYSYTYTHILESFGVLTLIFLFLVQITFGVILIKRSLVLKTEYESIVGALFGIIFLLQTVMGYASSFLLMPSVNIGAPLITCTGFEYGFAGLVYYFGRIIPEKRCEFGLLYIIKKGVLTIKNFFIQPKK